MSTTAMLLFVCFAPSAVLMALALWVCWTRPEPENFMEDIDDWGAQ